MHVVTESQIIQQVRERANFRCEYCLELLVGRGFHIEHILPRVRGGTDSLENYAAACPDCNIRKGKVIDGIDPLWLNTVRLFNPTADTHSDHFVRTGETWIGKTPIGRATAKLLFRSTPQFTPGDQFWPILQPLRISNEGLYWKMNTLRAQTKLNDFLLLDEVLDTNPAFRTAASYARAIAVEALTFLKLELRMLRARPSDIEIAIKTIQRLRRAAKRPLVAGELYGIESIFFKQMATAVAIHGNIGRSRQYQQVASAKLQQAIRLRGEDLGKIDFLSRRFRLMALESRFSRVANPCVSLNDVDAAISIAADRVFPDALLQIADVELAQRTPSRHAERMLQAVERSAEKVGYGQDFDFGVGLAVRRRWWELQIHLGMELKTELLRQDIKYWEKIGMWNEIRGLQLASLRDPDAREQMASLMPKSKTQK